MLKKNGEGYLSKTSSSFIIRQRLLTSIQNRQKIVQQTRGAFDWEIRISISDFGFWISQ